MKKLFSFRFKFKLLLFLKKFKPFDYFKNVQIKPDRNQLYIFLAADYGNLGDVAITYAQTYFLKQNTNYQLIEIPISHSIEGLWFVKKHIKNGDVVTTVGGGNMGGVYEQIEYIRQLVFSFFPKNKIISFPQTFDFAEDKAEQKDLTRAQRVYNRHSDLYLIAREKTSFNLMKKYFKNAKILLTPDIVLSLDKTKPEINRNGVLLCLRQDQEKSLSKDQEEFILKTAKNHFSEFSFYDTHNGKSNMTVQEREKDLNDIWSAFRSSELVITDRLHGMIFCYITGTPCLAFQNNNHKVIKTFDWIKHAGYIRLIPSFSEEVILDYIEEKQYSQTSNYIGLLDKFEPALDILEPAVI